MPEDKNGLGSPKELGFLSDSMLRTMLRDTIMMDETPDIAHLNALLMEMDRRCLDEPPISPEEAYMEFKKEYGGEPYCKSKHHFKHHVKYLDGYKGGITHRYGFMKTALAAVLLTALLFGSMVVVQALGVDVFGVTAKWTKETFSFFWEEKNSVSEAPGTLPKALNELSNMLIQHGQPLSFLPTFLPEGYEVSEVKFTVLSDNEQFYSRFTDGNGSITLQYIVHRSDEFVVSYEKSDGEPEEYVVNGRTFYLMTNKTQRIAAWVVGNVECMFMSSEGLSLSNFKTILNSIGGKQT